MSEPGPGLRDLYQEVILEHARRPRNRRRIDGDARTAEGHNPLCGDRVTVQVRLAGGVVADVAFEGQGCAISTASASIMTDLLRGKHEREARALFERFHALVTGRERQGDVEDLGKMAVFAGVSEFPARVKCASLAWHVAVAALDDARDLVTTE